MIEDHRPALAALAAALMGYALYTSNLYLEAPTQSLAIVTLAAAVGPLALTTQTKLALALPLRLLGILCGIGSIIWLFSLLNSRVGFMEFNYWPLLLMFFGVLAVGVFVIRELNRPRTLSMSAVGPAQAVRNPIDSLLDLPANDSFIGRAVDKAHAEDDAELLTLRNTMASTMLQIKQLSEKWQTLQSETQAIIEAREAAAKAGVHPNVHDSSEFQMEKLRAEVNQHLQLFEVKLEELRKSIDVKFAKVSDRYKESMRQRREQEKRRRPPQADNGQDVGADIPAPERTTDD